jgi:hypothetical protein
MKTVKERDGEKKKYLPASQLAFVMKAHFDTFYVCFLQQGKEK